MSETKLNLRQKLVQVYTMIDHVEKGGYNKNQKYNFVRSADVLRSVRNAFAELGVYAEPNYDLLSTYDIKTNSGGIMHTATVKATIKLYDCDSDETKTISGLGDGADSGDKGIYKAQTGATKNALRNGSLMPDEADPEADQQVDNYTDFRGTEVYAHPASTTEIPYYGQDYADARTLATHAIAHPTPAPQPEAPASGTASPAQLEANEVRANAGGPTPIVPEHGDAWEGPEVDRLPTEEEFVNYRARFKKLADDLSAQGKLTASKGLKLADKLKVFTLQVTKTDAMKNLTVSGWDSFFERADKAIANPEIGLVGLAKLINKANGLEPKE